MAKPKWIALDKTEGTGNSTLQVTAAAFTGRLERTGLITAVTDGGAQDSTTVTQEGKAEFIQITSNSLTPISAVGQEVTILGKSNSAALKVLTPNNVNIKSLAIDGAPQEDWDGITNINIGGDPGASAEYNFEIVVVIGPNQSESGLADITVVVDNSDTEDMVEDSITFSQAPGVKTYSEVVITDGPSYEDASPAGEIVTPSAPVYSQTWGWNGETTGGGTITSGADIAYSKVSGLSTATVDAETGAYTAPNLGTTVKVRTMLVEVKVEVTLNGKTAEKTVQAFQSANTATYGEVSLNTGMTTDIPASGGSISELPGVEGTQTVTFSSGANRPGEVQITYGEEVSAPSLGTVLKGRAQVGVLQVTATGEGGKSAEQGVPIYQAGNSATYGEVTIGMATPVSVPADGKEYNIKQLALAKQIVTYTSGTSRNETSSANPVIILIETEEVTPQTGFTLDNTDTLTVAANTSVDAREGYVLEITATGEGGKEATKQITFNQQGTSSQITLEPDTLEFEATGGQKSVTITATDSWTIS